MRVLLLFLLITLLTSYSYTTDLRNSFRCFIWDTSCVTALAQTLTPATIETIPELGPTKLDPLELSYFRIEKDGLLLEVRDAKVHGLNNLVVDELRAYTNLSMAHTQFRTDLFITGVYNVTGSMFFRPVNGSGDYWVSLKNLEVEIFSPYQLIQDAHGEDVLQINGYTFRYDVKDNAQFRFNNLYYGNTELSELMHSIFNENWKFITSHYARSFVSTIVDNLAKTYKSYFRLAPLRYFVEY